jgi:type IV/VI secretion system ImpK/VasF family protein
MLAEQYSASLIKPLPISSVPNIPEGYFRSKLFVTTSTSNPVMAAASPLLSLMDRLGLSPTLPALDSIRDNIEHELRAFHSRLTTHAYTHEFSVIALYLLSATIDELLSKNYTRLFNEPATFKAFTPPSQDGIGAEHRFFDIVERIKQHTNQYLDILELAYYCLIMGFEGELHIRADGRQTLDNLIEELHQLIQSHRVHQPYQLFHERPHKISQSISRTPLAIVALLTISILLGTYVISNLLIEHQAKRLITQHAVFLNMDT